MIMIKQYPGGSNAPPGKAIHYYNEVSLQKTINKEDKLKFNVPMSEYIPECTLISLENELYRVYSVRPKTKDFVKTIECEHVFHYDSKRAFIPNLGSTDVDDYIGVAPLKVITDAVDYANESTGGFSLFSAAELDALGMKWIDGYIDYESTDKTNLWDVLADVIEIAGRGELYYKNKKFAVVEQLGTNKNDIVVTSNLSNDVAIDYDISELVTKLYPYGENSLEITNATNNVTKTDYIISPFAEKYGIFSEGKDYEIADVDELYRRGLWEFDAANPDRIDVPKISISGNINALGLRNPLELGDVIYLMIDGTMYKERVISITIYPYSGKAADVVIGKEKRDLFFYLNQVGHLTRKYKKVSLINGNIRQNNVQGG